MREGTLLKGRYRLVRKRGKGGMGEVWQARDDRLDRTVAVKFLLRPAPEQADLLRFEAEARALARFQHPNIVSVHDVSEPGEPPFIVTEWLDGEDLDGLLSGEEPCGVREVVEISAQVCAGLAHAHGHGVVHRDLKPANVILLGDAGTKGSEAPPIRVKLIDFGLARRLTASGSAAGLTLDGAVLGTPAYMSPEQWRGRAADERSDLYALGCLIHALLTGEPPFPGRALTVGHAHLYDEPPPVDGLRDEVPVALAGLVERLLAKDPGDRPATAAEVHRELLRLARWLEEPAPAAEAPGGPAPTRDERLVVTGRHHTVPWPRPPVTGTTSAIPALTRRSVTRRELVDRGVAALADMIEDDEGAGVLALVGSGGFGKTTLATQIARDPRIREMFPGGVLWLELGQHATGPALASRINDVCEQVTGSRPGFVHPDQAGAHLRLVLGEQQRLLVVDDVWDRTQLRPLLASEESRTVRLVTTRVRSALPDGATILTVGAMRRAEARAMLGGTLAGVGTDEIDGFVKALGHWPVLMALADGAVRFAVEGGAAPGHALARVRDRLAKAGPTALDDADEEDRSRAVSATVETSLALLERHEAECYRALAIFQEDTEIPEEALRWAWSENGPRSAMAVERLCTRLADLSLVTPVFAGTQLRIRLHDTLRAYLRGAATADELARVNGRFLDAAAAELTPTGAAGAGTAWWAMPGEQTYLWTWLCWHLREAGRADLIAPLVGDLRHLTTKLRLLGPAEVVADLAMGGEAVAGLRRVVGASALLLTAGDPPGSLDDILLSRIGHVLPEDAPGLAEVYQAAPRRPALVNARPLPDLPSRALRHNIAGHDGSVWASAVTPEGTRAVTGGGDRLLRVWDVAAGRQVAVLPGHESMVNACVVGDSGTWMASCGDDRTVRVWDLEDEQESLVMDGFAFALQTMAAPRGGEWIATGDAGGRLYVRDRSDGAERFTVQAHTGGIRCCAADPSGTWILTGGEDMRVRVWSGTDHRLLADLGDHAGGVWAAAASPDGRRAVTCDSTGMVVLRGMPDGEVLRVVANDRGGVRTCAFAPDASWVAVGREDCTIRLYPLVDDVPERIFKAGSAVQTCAAGPDGGWLVSGGASGGIQVWDTDGAPTWSAETVLPAVQAMGAHPDGSLITGDATGEVRVWDLRGERVRTRFQGHTAGVWSVEVSPDAATVATSGDDRTVCLWDPAGGELLRRHVFTCGINDATFTANGERLITGGTDGGVQLVDTRTGAVVYHVRDHSANIWDCTPDSSGSWFVAGGDDGVTTARALATGEIITEFDHGAPIWGLAIAGDDVAVAGCGDGSLHVWWPESGERRVVHGAHPGGVWQVRPSPDGTWMVSVGEDRTVRTWSLPDLRPLRTLSGHDHSTNSCAVHPDGRWFASGDSVGTTRVWDSVTGRPLALLTDHSTGLRSCATGGAAQEVVVVGADDGHVELRTPGRTVELTAHHGVVRTVAVDGTGTVVLTAGDDGAVRLHDLRRGGVWEPLPPRGAPVWCAAFGPDDFGVLAADVSGRVVRIARDGRAVAAFGYDGAPVRACAVSPDGALMAWAGDRGVVRVGETGTGRERDARVFDASVRAVAFAPDGSWMVAGDLAGGVHVWGTGGPGNAPDRHGRHDTAVRACAVHPGGRLIVTADAGGTLKVWDPGTMRCVARMRVAAPLHGCAWAGDDIVAVGVAGEYRFTLTGADQGPALAGPAPSGGGAPGGRRR